VGPLKLDVLPGATYKPFWFYCMDDTFVVWPHGSERLRASSTAYTVGTILCSSPVTETGGHISFMDNDIYRRPDGFLGHKVHCRHT